MTYLYVGNKLYQNRFRRKDGQHGRGCLFERNEVVLRYRTFLLFEQLMPVLCWAVCSLLNNRLCTDLTAI